MVNESLTSPSIYFDPSFDLRELLGLQEKPLQLFAPLGYA
jgi:hypothetical protein